MAVVDESALEENFLGELIRPGDANYDRARSISNAMFDRRPAFIARCTGVADVIEAVRFARDADLAVAVRSGGHSVAGYGVCDDGIVIDLSPMRGVRVDPGTRTARAQAGLTWGQFDRETQAFGLATTGGRVTTTGIAGLTLGSGSGWLESKFGLVADNLLSVDIVTADGQVLTASEDENPELFWGLRGGGGNFGIATSFDYRLHQLGPIVVGLDTGFRFKVAGIDRTNNASWFYAGPGTSEERAMKQALHKGDASDLNVYSTTAGPYLGWAYFPSTYKTKPWIDGLVIDWASMLHTSTAYVGRYDLGKTGTHESGHWFGLYHVFQGGCNHWGDYVDDTPPQLIATRGCPEGQDSCSEPSLDSIHNYMDYSYDSCYNQFTAGQAAREDVPFAVELRDGGPGVMVRRGSA